MILVPIEARLAQLKAQLQAVSVGLPESRSVPGIPDLQEVSRLISADPSTFGFIDAAPRPARVLLWRLADEIGLTEMTVFRSAIAGKPVGTSSHQPDETMISLLNWADGARRLGIAIPERDSRPGEPNFPAIATAASIDLARLKSRKQPYRGIVLELARELGFVSTEAFGKAIGVDVRSSRAREAAENRISKIKAYLTQHHIRPDVPLPEANRPFGAPSYKRVCQSAGSSWKGKPDLEVNRIIDDAAQVVGIGADRFRPAGGERGKTFADLLEIGSRRFELEEGSSKNINRFRWAFRTWLNAIDSKEADTAEGDLCRMLHDSIAQYARSISNAGTRRHWVGAMSRWQRYFEDLAPRPEEDLPPTFGGALRALVRKSGSPSLKHLVRAAGLERYYVTIHDWLHTGREPLLTEQTVIANLEASLGVAPGTLFGRIRRHHRPALGHMLVKHWPPSLDRDLVRRMAKPCLPANFAYLSDLEREQIGRIIRAEIDGEIAFRRRMRGPTKEKAWRLNPLPDPLEAEIRKLVAYKTAAVAPHPRDRKWRPGTVKRNRGILTTIFSAMALPPFEGGLGIPTEDLSLGYFANISVFSWFIEWLSQRYPDGLNTGARAVLGLIAYLTTPNVVDKKRRRTGKKGYLHYVPALGRRLKPIPGVLTSADIDLITSPEGWVLSLTEVNSKVWEVFNDQQEGFLKTRDPFEPILPILEMERPLDALVDMLARAFRDLPDPIMASPYRRAIAVRRFVAVLVEVRTFLRRRNVAELTYRRDGRGKLRRDIDHWLIEIPKTEFKNAAGPFFANSDEPYVCHLPVEDTAIIDEYVNVSRALLLDEKQDEALFINRYGKPLNDERLYEEVAMMTWTYLVYHQTSGSGIPGVERFGPHAIRDIGGTHILKTTGDINLAADALQDSPQMIMKHYARYLPRDRTKRVTNFLAENLRKGGWG